MTSPTQDSQAEVAQNAKPDNKELNFRALEAKFQRQLEQARQETEEAKRVAQEALSKKQSHDDDDDDSEPYVDRKRLRKEQEKFGQQIKKDTQSEIKQAVSQALSEERRQNWIKNPHFYEVMQHADKFAEKDPNLPKQYCRCQIRLKDRN